MRRKRSPHSAFRQPGSTPNRRFAQKMSLDFVLRTSLVAPGY
jgi:hypothetical protein